MLLFISLQQQMRQQPLPKQVSAPSSNLQLWDSRLAADKQSRQLSQEWATHVPAMCSIASWHRQAWLWAIAGGHHWIRQVWRLQLVELFLVQMLQLPLSTLSGCRRSSLDKR